VEKLKLPPIPNEVDIGPPCNWKEPLQNQHFAGILKLSPTITD
jgi:hypothetical protein